MKKLRTVYVRISDQLVSEEDIFKAAFIADCVDGLALPASWRKLGEMTVDIPDELINSIITANTKADIDNKIAKHKAEIIRLEEFRSKTA